MQVAMTRAIDAAATEPLLPARLSSGRGGSSGGGGGGGTTARRGEVQVKPAPATSNLHFLRRFRALLRLLRPYPALILSLLAVAEAVVVAEVGKVAGSFYLIVVDGQPSKFAAAMLHAAALYAASTALYAAATWVTENLALHWRQRLTAHLHHCYCHHQHAYYRLQQGQAQQAAPGQEPHPAQQPAWGQEAHQDGHQQQDAGNKQRQSGQGQQQVDNPDQRIASDAGELCECLSAVARVAAAAPFKLLYYSWLTGGYLGWRGLAAVYAFFWLAAVVQRLAVSPVARLVFAQERREGDLRYAHVRLRQYAAEVAQYRAAHAERRHLDATLAAALSNQRLLVSWRAALAGATRAVDYAGAMLNYCVVGAAVFAGMVGGGGDSGRLAQFVSNASFATLTLIYTFTELLDLSDQLSKLGGLTARVGQLLEALPGGAKGVGGGSGELDGGGVHDVHDVHAVRLSMDGGAHELRPSRFATLLQPPRLYSCLGGSVVLEASTHRLGPDLQREARAIFPDAPATGQLLACITFQHAAGGASLAPDSSSATLERAAAEMDRLLDAFLRWEAGVSAALAAAGRWCDAVDPRSGTALHGRRGARWSEVAAAHALLGYERRDAGICPVVLHPRHGSSAYPATLFTDAPPAELERALAAVSDQPAQLAAWAAAGGGPTADAGGGQAWAAADGGSTVAAPLLSLHGVAVRTPAGALAAAGLSLELLPGQHLLIAGPNGCGKSTLVKALCGLHPLEGGSVLVAGRAPPVSPGGGTASPGASSDDDDDSAAQGGAGRGQGVMFVPQRPLAAPGGALWQQICYPADGGDRSGGGGGGGGGGCEGQAAADEELLVLLQRVGLQYLLDRVGDSFQAAADWAAMLSPGELQRLAVARVLHRRPALAVLDELTSAVSEEAAARLYGQLHAEGITCVSIGQDSAHLRRLHRRLLRLGCGPPDGAWQLHPCMPPAT